MIKYIYIVILFIGISNNSVFGQLVDNVKISVQGENILVTYDLTYLYGKAKGYDLTIFYSMDNGKTWHESLKKYDSNLENQYPGENKKAWWTPLKEIGEYEGYIQLKILAVPSEWEKFFQYRKNKIIWMCATLAFSAVGTYSYFQSENFYSQYGNATNNASDLHQKVKLYDQITPVAFGVAGFCALEFILNAGKQRKASNAAFSFYPQPINYGIGIGMVCKF